MKTVVLILLFIFHFTAVVAQDSLSIGVFTGPAFKANAEEIDNDFNTQTLGKAQKYSLSYGISAQWFPLRINKKTKKNAFELSLLISKKKIEAKHTGEDVSQFGNGTVDISNVFEYQRQSRAIFVGYKRYEPIHSKFSMVSGCDIGYIDHRKSTQTSKRIEKKQGSNDFMGESFLSKEYPKGYSAGLLLNFGLEYKLAKTLNIGLSVSSGAFFTHTYGEVVALSVFSIPNNNFFENKSATYANSNTFTISPINTFLFLRYVFGG